MPDYWELGRQLARAEARRLDPDGDVPCPQCHETGLITDDGDPYDCPDCEGTGYVSKEEWDKFLRKSFERDPMDVLREERENEL